MCSHTRPRRHARAALIRKGSHIIHVNGEEHKHITTTKYECAWKESPSLGGEWRGDFFLSFVILTFYFHSTHGFTDVETPHI